MKKLSGQEQDVALVAAIKNGSQSAFAELYKKYDRGINYFCLTFVSDRVEAQDLCIELFMKVSDGIKTYDASKAKFNTWIYNMAKNYFIDYTRKTKAEVLSISSLSSHDEEGNEMGFQLPSNTLNPEQTMVNRERVDTVRDIINGIQRPAHREIAKLRFVDDLSYKEISEITGKKMGTVKGILFRAVKEIEEGVIASDLEKAPELAELI